MSKAKLVGGLLGLGVLVAVLAGGSKKAKAAPKVPGPGEPTTPEEAAATQAAQARQEPAAAQALATATATPSQVNFATAVIAALSTGNPETVRATADKLAALGYPYGAQLRAIADDMAKSAESRGATRATPAETLEATSRQKELSKEELPASAAAEPGADPGAEADEAPDEPPAAQPAQPAPASAAAGRADAEALAAHLRPRAKGTEDRAMVRAYQTRHGLKVDGLFGPQTASDVASYGVVPPTKNVYWPTNWQQAKRDMIATLLQYAQQFPAAAAAFTQEARSIK